MKFIIYITIYTLINAYILLRILGWIKYISKRLNKNYVKIPFVCLYVLCYLAPIIGYFLPLSNFQKNIQEFANGYVGILIYMFMIAILSDIIKLISIGLLKLKGNISEEKMKNFFYVEGIIAVVIVVLTTSYGLIHAKHIKVKEYNVEIKNKTISEETNLKIALIADFHLGYNVGYEMIQDMVNKVNNENVDLIFIGGDIFDNSSVTVDDFQKCQEALASMKSKYGTYAVFGNHDVDERLFCGFGVQSVESDYRNKDMENMITSAGIKILDDEVTMINDSIYLIGRKDAEKSGFGSEGRENLESLIEKVDTSKPVIVLEHEPVELEKASSLGVDLHLAGHTHAGQFFPLTIGTTIKWFNSYGLKHIGNMSTVVTSGIGVYGPNMRVGTDSEISIVNLSVKGNGSK